MTNITNIPLDSKAVAQYLSWPAHPFNFHFYQSLDSTNRFLRDLSTTTKIDVCCSEGQTAGRGRFGRTWYSPFGENLYCSSRWAMSGNLSGLSLVVSLAILATIKPYIPDVDLAIKWPNDILWDNKKLCGTLIEIAFEHAIIIGIGLNVNSIVHEHAAMEKPWCSLYEIGQKSLNRNQLLADLLTQLHQYLTRFQTHGFSAFLEEWQQIDYLKGKALSVFLPGQTVEGQAMGVNEKGELIVQDLQGKIHCFQAGETSLRPLKHLP